MAQIRTNPSFMISQTVIRLGDILFFFSRFFEQFFGDAFWYLSVGSKFHGKLGLPLG